MLENRFKQRQIFIKPAKPKTEKAKKLKTLEG